MKKRLKILFDFDGTLCRLETIPTAASRLRPEYEAEMMRLSEMSLTDAEGYALNLQKRLSILEGVDVKDFVNALPTDILRKEMVGFIKEHPRECGIASCNIDCWCEPLVESLGVVSYFSKGRVVNGKFIGIESLLDKGKVVERYQEKGYEVVFAGDSANDIEAILKADTGILFGESLNRDDIGDDMGGDIKIARDETSLIKILEEIIVKYDNINQRRTTIREKSLCRRDGSEEVCHTDIYCDSPHI